MTTQPASLHQRLQGATRDAHLRVERSFDLEAMTRSAAAYQQCLLVLEASLSSALRSLGEVDWSTWRPDLARLTNRHAWLLQDLRALKAPSRQSAEHLELGSLGQGLGCLYVLEGSALGGLVIYNAARRTLGVTPETGGRYFQGVGRSTVSDWKIFLTALNTIPARSVLGDEAETGALRTFGMIESTAHIRDQNT